METASVTLEHRLAPEDQARADCYALLAALFGDVASPGLLRALAEAPRLPVSGEASFAGAYNRLLDASAAMDPEAARQEYVELFVGVGKSEVDPHASHWRREPGSDRWLAVVRADLARLGLARRAESSLYEDHIAALCETMRFLIAGDDERRPANTEEQVRFFDRHLSGWVDDFCSAVTDCALANYYIRVAELCRFFMALERDSLAME